MARVSSVAAGQINGDAMQCRHDGGRRVTGPQPLADSVDQGDGQKRRGCAQQQRAEVHVWAIGVAATRGAGVATRGAGVAGGGVVCAEGGRGDADAAGEPWEDGGVVVVREQDGQTGDQQGPRRLWLAARHSCPRRCIGDGIWTRRLRSVPGMQASASAAAWSPLPVVSDRAANMRHRSNRSRDRAKRQAA